MINFIKDMFGGQSDKKIEKQAKVVQKKLAIKEDRQAAIDFFVKMDDFEKSIPVLLSRFEYSLDHGINDTREKEHTMEGIIKHGEDAIPLLKEKRKTTTKIAWPLKILQKVCTDDTQIVDVLLDSLNFGDISFDQGIVDKNFDLLCYLVDYKRSDICQKIIHFISDHDERVRFAAAEVLAMQDDESVSAELEKFIFDESNENRRIRKIIMDTFARNKWKVKDRKDSTPSVPIADGIFLNKDGFLEKRG